MTSKADGGSSIATVTLHHTSNLSLVRVYV